jgi:hypothetical protein
MTSRFTATSDIGNIILHLASLQKEQEVFQAWQKLNHSRLIANFGIDKLYPRERTLLLRIIDDSPSGLIDPFTYSQIYLKSLQDLWVTKSECLLQLSDGLVITVPDELYFLEKRIHDRYKIADHEQLEMILSLRSPNGRKPVSLKLNDISRSGAQINVPNKILPYFYSSENLLVQQIGDNEIERPIEASIIRRLGINPRKKTLLPFALEFKQLLPENVLYQSIDKKCA